MLILAAGTCGGLWGCDGGGAKAVRAGGRGSAGRQEPLPGAITGGANSRGGLKVGEVRSGDGKDDAKVAATAPEKASEIPKSEAASATAAGGLPAADMLAGRLGGRAGDAPHAPAAGRDSPQVDAAPTKRATEKVKPAPMVAAAKRVQEVPLKEPPPAAVVERVQAPDVFVVRPSTSAIKAGVISARVGERDVSAPLWFVYPEIGAAAAEGTPNHVRDWIGSTATWRVAKAAPKLAGTPGNAASAGMWVAVLRVGAASVSIDGKFVWRFSDAGGALPRQTHVASSAFALEMLGALRGSPLVRWRARLAAGEPLVAEHAPDAFADATIEGLARTIERAWADVLGRLNAANPDLAERFAARLGGVVDIGEGVSIPIWPADVNSGATLDSLLQDLTAAGEDAARAAAIATSWLETQPIGGAVVIDDAAAVDLTTGLTFPSVLLANLSDQPAAAMASRAETAAPDLLRLEPLTAVFASVGAAAAPNDEGLDARQRTGLEAVRKMGQTRTMADVRVGEWRGKRAVVGEVVKIRPPGLDIGLDDGPLMSDWTQESFLDAAMETTSRGKMLMSAASRGFVGRLKPADDKGAAPGGAGKWMMVFEVARSAARDGASAGAEDRAEFVLSFGPRGGGTGASLRVLADGSLFEVRNGQAMPAGSAVVKKAADRTFYWVPVPTQAIEGGKVLRIGLVRIDERGRRSAWPRPMLPWQTEPGRIAVDLSSWSPVKE